MSFRGRTPHQPVIQRPGRLLVARRKQEASIEREPEQLPAICRSCGVVLGLISTDELTFCRECGVWVAADDEILEVAG